MIEYVFEVVISSNRCVEVVVLLYAVNVTDISTKARNIVINWYFDRNCWR